MEADRRACRADQQLLDFSPDALCRQVVERRRPADLRGRRIDPAVEARRELQRTQHAQAVVAERPRIDHPQQPPREILASAMGVEMLAAERIPADRVDREVAPAGRLRERQVRIAVDLEPLVSTAGLRLTPRQRHVEALHLEHREALADGVDGAPLRQQRLQVVDRQSEDLEVEILRRMSEQRVTDVPAHDQRTPASRAHRLRNGPSEAANRRRSSLGPARRAARLHDRSICGMDASAASYPTWVHFGVRANFVDTQSARPGSSAEAAGITRDSRIG